MPDRSARSHLDPIREAAICLNKDQGGFVGHGRFQSNRFQPGQPHTYTQNLARTEMIVAGRRQLEKFMDFCRQRTLLI